MALSPKIETLMAAAIAMAEGSAALREVVMVNTNPVLFGVEASGQQPPIIQDADMRLSPAGAQEAANRLMQDHWSTVRTAMIGDKVASLVAAKNALDAAWAAAVAEYGDGSGPFE